MKYQDGIFNAVNQLREALRDANVTAEIQVKFGSASEMFAVCGLEKRTEEPLIMYPGSDVEFRFCSREEPKFLTIKAKDIIPYRHALWCRIGEGKPFANPIVHKRMSDDGLRVCLGLDSHQGFFAGPEQDVDNIVAIDGWMPNDREEREAKFQAELARLAK